MITALVRSAFQNGYLSVESEGLIRQVLASGGCRTHDLDTLQQLYDAVRRGDVQREASRQVAMPQIPGGRPSSGDRD